MPDNQPRPLLSIHLEGPAVHEGRILLDDLLQFVSNIGVAVERIVNVLETGTGIRVGRPPRTIQLLSALEIVSTSPGSFAVDLDLRRPHPLLPEFDVGETAVGKLVAGLPAVQEDTPLPEGFDDGVLTALREAGRVLDKGIDLASLEYMKVPHHSKAIFTVQTRDRVVTRLRRFQQSWTTVEGRLLMADVRETLLRCRIHPSTGGPILCEFPEHLAPYVMRNLRQFVRARGEAVIERATGKVKSLKVLDLEPVDRVTLHEPQVPSTSFWSPSSFEDLAQEQGIYPIADWEQLTGSWPEDADFDAFMEAIHEAQS